jgi:hypothetical protein
MPTRISEMPMTRMIVPVTTGGKSGSTRLTKGAITMPKSPAAMTDPKMPRRPISGAAAIDSIGPIEAKVTPIITGSRMPTPGNP